MANLTGNIILALILVWYREVGSVKVGIEAESTTASFPKHYRSLASNGQTLYLHQNDYVTYNFCLIKPTSVILEDVITSNDGPADTIQVKINDGVIGTFQSVAGSNYGFNWNVFSPSGQIGQTLNLGAGQHSISIYVIAADNFGVEVDVFKFDVLDDEVSKDTFTCYLKCIDTLPSVTALPGLIQSKAVQKSYSTMCTEEDNVDVAIFNKGIAEYEITATAPLYDTSMNMRHPDTTNCPFLTPIYWLYEDVVISPTTAAQTSNDSILQFRQKSSDTTEMLVTFTLKGKKNGYIDSNIGSKLFMNMEPPAVSTEVTVRYLHRNGSVITFDPVTFDSSVTAHTWDVPDFTWKEDIGNYIFIDVKSANGNQILSNFKMERRYMGPDQVVSIYETSTLRIEGVKIDFWWQAPENMEVTLTTSQEIWNDIAYFRIANLQTDGFAQVFVLYQDGNMRLLYKTPSQFDWIPFGTSVILGQTKVDDFRPAVSINKVDINPQDLTMELTYDDNSKTTLKVIPSASKTTLQVYEMDLKKNKETHPFATFRSMYVETGNNDADNIISDQSSTKRVLGGSWKELLGNTFMMYRRCESKHLTQSPDITVTVTKTEL
ncbi:hypothetical protein LOTGIDRAFT_154902 [Lottia gigantea]|uniref:Uncharacterized protein n=1 Tax=Lottia gigantea TaxID=225164 RepID=V3ZWU1_LOTGI|nr:hypothetical protein LOTGIDRAFT_154902 [Lottia gigantea]ESO85406.1 hypothetical protein LOTGIDRAFT_154902 [Lottia gigantea]